MPRVAVLILAWYALVFNTMLIAAAFAAPSSAHWNLCLAASNTGDTENAPAQPGPAQIPACAKHCLNSATGDGVPGLAPLALATATSLAVIFPHPPIAWTDAAWSGVFARGPPEKV